MAPSSNNSLTVQVGLSGPNSPRSKFNFNFATNLPKVEACIVDHLRILAYVQRLYRGWICKQIFFLCGEKENIMNANFLRILFLVLNLL